LKEFIVKKLTLYFVVACLIFGLPSAYCQDVCLTAGAGYGSFKMNDLKQVNQEDIQYLPYETRLTDNYPMFWNYSAAFTYNIKKWLVTGVSGSFQSAGSGVTRSDYSGDYSFITKIHSISPGLIIRAQYQYNKLSLFISNDIGIEYNDLRIKETLNVFTHNHEEIYNLSSRNIFYLPTTGISLSLFFINLEIYGGYLMDIKKNDLKNHEGNTFMMSSGLKTVRADWSGLRFGAKATVRLFKFASDTKQITNEVR
jgi:hypothetical protein